MSTDAEDAADEQRAKTREDGRNNEAVWTTERKNGNDGWNEWVYTIYWLVSVGLEPQDTYSDIVLFHRVKINSQ